MINILLAASLALGAAGLNVSIETDRIDGLYSAGETATVSVVAKDGNGALARSGCVGVKVDNFGKVSVTNLTADFAVANPFTFRLTRPDAGFLRVNAGGKLCGVGFDVERIAPGTPNPSDFAAFWRKAIAQYDRAIPSAPEVRVDEALSDADWIVERVAFDAPNGRKVYGFVSRERKAKGRLPGRVEISAAGYGGWSQAPSKDKGRITLKMTVYPFEPDVKLGRKADYEAGNTNAMTRWGVNLYCKGGISESREAYFFYPVILANNRAIDWFAARPDVDAAKIDYRGTSQGGGLGLAAMALNSHFARGCVFVPALTDVMGFKAGERQSGWPQLVESHPPAARAAAERNAPYFCGVNFARMVKIPIRFVVGHVDTTCSPNAVYSAYNVCPSADKAIVGGIGMGHGAFGDYYSYLDAWSRGCEREGLQYRFLAFNIWGDYFGNPVAERAGDIAALVKRWNPDIAGFQEMTPRFWKSALVTELEGDYAFVGRGIGVKGHDVHTPVLYRRSRFDLVESGIVLQCPELDESKGAVWAVLRDKSTGRKLVAFASHAWWRYDGAGDDWIRLNGAKMLTEKLQELAKRHDAAVVGGGDLNAPLESGSIKWLLTHGYADAQASADISPRGFPTEHGDPKRGPDGRYVGRNGANGHNRVEAKYRYLDHIFFDPTRVAARRFDIDISPVACRISDHHPIILDFSSLETASCAGSSVDICSFGAAPDATPAANAAAIQKAIGAVADGGGGRVVVPAGRYVIGTIWLKSNVELHLAKNAQLVGSPALADYNADDAYPENWGCPSEGWQAKHLIVARDAENVAITGPGTIDGNGSAFFARGTALNAPCNSVWRHGYTNSEDSKNAVRPGQEIVFVGCRNVRVEGLFLRNMSCWTCYFHGCERVRVSRCTIRTLLTYANTDGFDIDCCRDVVVTDCDIETGDDCLTIRASAVERLGRFARPCEDIVFSNCICRCSASGVRIGVGTGTIRNVLLRDLDIRESGHGIVIQSSYPGSKQTHGEGVTISNVAVENVRIRDSGLPLIVSSGSPKTCARISDLAFRNLDMESSGSIVIEGCGVHPVENIAFDGLRFEVYARSAPYSKDWEVVGTNCDHEAAVCIDRTTNVRFKDARITFRHDRGDTRSRIYSRVNSH